MSSPVTVFGVKGASMRVSLVQRRERWWWFITPDKRPDPPCWRGDAANEEAALEVALYEARKLVGESN